MFRDVLTHRILSAAAREAKERPTPFYLFDPDELARQARAWRRAAQAVLPADIFYPYKCNRAAPVADLLAREGLGAEVTSSADFDDAAARGLTGKRIVIQGPAKSTALIDAGLAAGVLLVADGREDLLAILDRGRAISALPRYLLRLAPCSASPEQSAFGLPARELVALADEVSRRKMPRPEGLAFHLGTGIASAAPYLTALREAAAIASELAALGIPIFRLDLGGGFAARSESRLVERGRPRSTRKDPTRILPALAKRARSLLGARLQLLFEPGRALVSASLHLVTRVIRIRKRSSQTTIYVDASRLSHAFFVARGRHRVASIPRRRGPSRDVALAGPLGAGLDLFTPATRLAPLAPGDLVVVGSVGAYNWNAASSWAGPVPPIATTSEAGREIG